MTSKSGVICRYKIQGVVVDVMPTSEQILGFSNRWYIPGFANAPDYILDEHCHIKIFQPAYFLASKLEAFNNRGFKDGRTSTDFEDIVYLLSNRSTIWEELHNTELQLNQYIVDSFQYLLKNKYISEWISAHLEFSQQERQYFILDSMKDIVLAKPN